MQNIFQKKIFGFLKDLIFINVYTGLFKNIFK